MLSTILEAALRSVALAIPAALIARVFLRAHPRLELTVWTLVLVGALAMPAVMQRAPIALLPARWSWKSRVRTFWISARNRPSQVRSASAKPKNYGV